MSLDIKPSTITNSDLIQLSVDIVTSYVSRNSISVGALSEVIISVHAALESLDHAEPATPPSKPKPAVSISKSVHHDYLVCLEDGKHLKMLKRYLQSRYDLSPDAYRRKWNLPLEYPMVAPAYAARRSEFAKKIGLGRGVRRGA